MSVDEATVIPAAAQMINQEVQLIKPVAQAESTRNYFLAQTLESTKTIPVVSASLPLDTGSVGVVVEPEGEGSDATTEEGEDGDDDPDAADPSLVISSEPSVSEASREISPAIAPTSTVVGSFISNGITFAVEPGGESVAAVAADYAKLPTASLDAQTIVLPSTVSADGINNYSVTRIADNAFASLVISSDSEKSALLIENREADTISRGDAETTDEVQVGITAITIPASIAVIDDDAFTGFDTLEYIIVSADNPNYSMYDGALYDADQTCLLLIPEGRTGAVRVADSTVEARVETFSHHADLTLYVNADSAAFTSENGFDTADVAIVTEEDDAADEREPLTAAYNVEATVEAGGTVNVLALLELDQPEEAAATVVASQGTLVNENATELQLDKPGTAEVALVLADADVPAFYALHLTVEGEEPVAAPAAEAAELEVATVTQYNADAVVQEADPTFIHNAENCSSGGTVLPGEPRAYGWTCPHFQDYAAPVYDSRPGTPGYVWVPSGITPSANISKQAVEAGEYYLLAGGKSANTGVAGSGGLFPASQVRNDYGKAACAWWEITASKPNATMGTLRIHCDYGTTIVNTWNAIGKYNATWGFSYATPLAPKSALNAWHNATDFGKIRDVVFDHVDTDSCQAWFQTSPYGPATPSEGASKPIQPNNDPNNIETVTFLGNTAPPSVQSFESTFSGASNLYEFSENFTLVGLDSLEDIRWMFFECGKFASFPLQFNQPSQLVAAWGWLEDCISVGSLPDAFRCAPGLKDSNDPSIEGKSLHFMFGLNNSKIRKLHPTLCSGSLLEAMNKALNKTRTWYYAGNDGVTLDYLQRGKGNDYGHTVIQTSHVTWDARGGTFSYSPTSSPTGSTYSPLAYNCSYVEPLYEVNGATVTSNKKTEVRVPQSPQKDDLHFIGWYVKVPVGEDPDQMASNEKNCVYRWERLPEPWGSGFDHNGEVMTAPEETTFIYALYAEDEFVSDIHFDLNTGTGTAPATIYDQTVNVAMRESHIDITGFNKPGYKFDGFWTDKTGGKQYYDEYGVASEDIRWTEQEHEVTLYAHWTYKVYLDLNTYNTDNQLVLNDTTATKQSGLWVANDGAELEMTQYLLDTQSGLIADATPVQVDGVMVEGATGAQSVQTTRYYIEATQGAPLQLPKVIGRTGYEDTCAWGLDVPTDRDGTASRLIAQQSDNCFLLNDNQLAAAYAAFVAGHSDYDAAADEGITLYADWSGKANSYWVQLWASYSTGKAPTDTFNAGANGTQFVQVTYDQPIPVAGLQKPVDTTTVTNSVTGVAEPRNLRLTGFRTQQNSVLTNDGTEYVRTTATALTNETADSTPANPQTIKFRETNDGKTGAITMQTTVPGVGSRNVILLYAKYLYPEVAVTVDLQGGYLDDPSASPSFTVVTNDPVPELAIGVNDVPTRPGFMFNGYWTTKYTEDAGSFETINGRKVETKRYYEATYDGAAMVPVPDAADPTKGKAWTSYEPTDTLYAHWKYKIYLNTNEWYLGATAAGNEATIATVPGLQTDVNGTYILATVGEPVELPEVTGRTGYKDDTSVAKNAWGVAPGKYGAATAFIPLESNGTFTTDNTAAGSLDLPAGKSLDLANADAKSAWGEDLFTASVKSTTFPQPEPNAQRMLPDGTLVDNPEYQSITLYLDWSTRAKTYTVILEATYDDVRNKITYNAHDGYTRQITAQYDAPLLKQLADGTVVTTVGDKPVFAPIYKKTPKSGYQAYDDQVFSGYYDAILGGTEYISAQVNNDGTTITSQMVPTLTGSTASYMPYRLSDGTTLYAHWSMPVCQVGFDMNDGKITRDGAAVGSVTKAFTVTSGDDLPRFGATDFDRYGNTNTDFLKTAPFFRTTSSIGSDYVFAGYWDAPVGGTRYYTASCEPVPGKKWDKYGNVTLYAHWTYKVELNMKDADTAPMAGYEDSLQVLGGGSSWITNADGNLETTVTYGDTATIPATKTAVTRLRNATGALAKEPTGYTFTGWLPTQTATTSVGGPTTDLVLGSANKGLLQPTNGVVKLYAGWEPVKTLVKFDYTSDGAFTKVQNFRPNADGDPIFGLESTPVMFDGTLLSATTPEPAPQLMGWTFQGYWTKPQAATDVTDSAADKGVQYAKPVDGDPTLMVGMPGMLWTEASSSSQVVLYAHYVRIPYKITFDVNAGTDKVTNTAGNAVTNASLGAMATYYDMDLSAKPAHQVRRAGYTFLGWSTEADYDTFAAMSAADQAEALYFGSDGNGVAGKRYLVEGDVDLYALWEPITYTITWDHNYPENNGVSEETTNQDYGRAIGFPTDPVFAGWEFLGWFTKPVGGEKVAAGPYKVVGPARYYAQWDVTKYHLTLLPGDYGTYSDAASATDGKVQPDGSYLVEFTISSADADLKPYRQPSPASGYKFVGWEQLVSGDAATGVYRETGLSKEGCLTADRLRTDPSVYDGAVFRAMWDTQVFTLSLDPKGGTMSGGWPATTKFTVEDTLTLPDVTLLGYTFKGWYEPGSSVRVTEVSAGTTGDLTYEARFDKNVYELQFVLGDGADARDVLVADPVFVSLGDPAVTIPYPTRFDTFEDGVAAAGKKPCSIFWHYEMTDELARTRFYHADDTVSVDDLLTNTYLRDADGNPLGNGSVIKFYADWTSSYQVSVPLTVEISFDPKAAKVEDTILVGDHRMEVTNASTEGDAIEVARVICEPTEPTAGSGTAIGTPGTLGAFAGDGGVDLSKYVTLTLSARAKNDVSPLRFAMDDVADTTTTTSVTHLNDASTTPAELKTLGEAGFRFGGKTGISTLPLYFNLEFATSSSFTPRMLKGLEPIMDKFVPDAAGNPTAQRTTYPIAKLYYVLALDHKKL